jgi:hypothetical protein
MLIEAELDEISARLQYSPQKHVICPAQETSLKFQVSVFEVSSLHSFWKGISTHECEHFMKMKGVNVYEQGQFPAFDMIRVDFVYDRLAYRLVDYAADQNTYGEI